jgi:hypothetical protein
MLAVVLAPVQMHLTMSVGALARIPAVATLHHLSLESVSSFSLLAAALDLSADAMPLPVIGSTPA